MANIYRQTPIYFAQFPQELFDGKIWHRLKPGAKDLLIFLQYMAQKVSKPTIELTAEEIEQGCGLSVNSVKSARDQLVNLRLVSAKRKLGGYTYELLDPHTGKSIQRVEDFDALESYQLEAFWAHHLGDKIRHREKDGLRAFCPFPHPAEKDRPVLHLELMNGGRWHCFTCQRSGKLVAFEMEMAKLRNEWLTQTQAHHKVMSIVLAAAREHARQQASEIQDNRRELFGGDSGDPENRPTDEQNEITNPLYFKSQILGVGGRLTN